jgi:DNA mismatch repair ATPase MutS
MNVFLMYKNRDFDSERLLARRAKTFQPDKYPELDLRHLFPENKEALKQDLGLDILLESMAGGDAFLIDVSEIALFSGLHDTDTIRYRQHIFSDCLVNEEYVREMYRIALEAVEWEKDHYYGFSRTPGAVLGRSTGMLLAFVELLKKLRGIADEHQSEFRSDGFNNLLATLKRELSDEYLATIENHLDRLKFRKGVLISAGLGEGGKGRDYAVCKSLEDKRIWLTRMLAKKQSEYTFEIHPRDFNGARMLSELNDRGISRIADTLGRSADHVLGFFQMLRTELAFYIGCLNLHEKLAAIGGPICFPEPASPGSRELSASGLYDVCLALNKKKRVVGNDLEADGKNLCMITGANTGGKSTFLRSVGIAQLMMQAGMFVPAESFSAEICDGVFTHFKREEDKKMESGKWDEELSRMSGIVDHLKPNSLMLFNESFASTNELEGSAIADQITVALLEKRIKIFYVTHLYTFARGIFDRKSEDVLSLRAERKPDGTRTFKMKKGEPLETSYGEDLYQTIFSDSNRSIDRTP